MRPKNFDPLQAHEVPDGMLVHLDQQMPIDGNRCVLGECPVCHKQRWIRIAFIRIGHTKRSICRECYLEVGNPAPLRPEEAPSELTILYFDKQELVQEKSGRKQQMLRILGECPDCHKQRWVRVNTIRNGKTRSTLCPVCARQRAYHPLAKKGMQITNGYRELNIRILSPEDQSLVAQFFTTKDRRYVYEHRLVALKTFGPSALAPGTVVRHIDGNKLNNDPDNLRLGTQSENRMDHVTAIAEMRAWRHLAIQFARLLIERS